MKNTFSGIILTLLLLATLALSFDVQPAGATGTIYIKADGSIVPSANITTADNVTYYFTDNNYDEIVVERSNIIVDGDGYTLQGSESGNGFNLTSVDNVTIQDANIKNFHTGIFTYQSSFNTFSGNNIANNERGVVLGLSSNNSISGNNITDNMYGVWLYWSSDNSVSRNNMKNGYVGIYLTSSSSNTISGNNITSNNRTGAYFTSSSNNNNVSGNSIRDNDFSGILLASSSNSVLRNNILVGNLYNFGVVGSMLSHFTQDVDDSNTVDGKPIYYFMNQKNLVIDPSTCPNIGYLGLVDSTNITIRSLELKNNYQGILLVNTTNSQATSNTITNNFYGVFLHSSSNNTVSANNVTDNHYGVQLHTSSDNNPVSGNDMTNNHYGVSVYWSSDNSVYGNTLTTNYLGIHFDFWSSNNSVSGNTLTNNNYGGVFLGRHCENNSVYGNTLTNNDFGVWLHSSCNNNTFSGNTITDSYYGFRLHSSSDNKLYHNNFVNNIQQVYDESWNYPAIPSSINAWDDGYPSGGNYWSDYDGDDIYNGPYQNVTGSDGMGDTPCVIDGNNQDTYPLMSPWTSVPPAIHATVDVIPNTISSRIMAKYVTAFVELPEGYNVSDINVSTILLNGTIPVHPDAPTAIGDYDGDGIPDLMVKFDRASVIEFIEGNLGELEPERTNPLTYQITLTLTGLLDDRTAFEGSDTIRVLKFLRGQPAPK